MVKSAFVIRGGVLLIILSEQQTNNNVLSEKMSIHLCEKVQAQETDRIDNLHLSRIAHTSWFKQACIQSRANDDIRSLLHPEVLGFAPKSNSKCDPQDADAVLAVMPSQRQSLRGCGA